MQTLKLLKNKNNVVVLFLTIIFFAISGCSVKYVADYNAEVKNEIVKVSKKVDIFWGTLLDTKTSNRGYANFKKQYTEIESDIRGLVLRNSIRPLNTESIKQAEIALDLWITDKENHKKNDKFSDFVAKRSRKAFTRVFTAMAVGEDSKQTVGE